MARKRIRIKGRVRRDKWGRFVNAAGTNKGPSTPDWARRLGRTSLAGNNGSKNGLGGRRANGKANVVPYARVGTRSSSVGVNAGMPVGKGFRLSTGVYVRVSRTTETGFERKINSAADSIAGKIAPHESLKPLVRGQMNRLASKAMAREINGPRGSQVRLGTSSVGTASVTIRKGLNGKTNTAPRIAREQAITRYNQQLGLKPRNTKKPRPQRRGRDS